MFDTVIKRPKITMMFVLILTIVGALTLFQLPQREIPEFTFDIGTISTPYPGGAPEEVEQQVTVPIENAIDSIEGISAINSVSTSGFSNIVLELEDGVDSARVFTEVQQAVTQTSGSLPDAALTPEVSQASALGGLSSYHILGDSHDDLYELRDEIAEWQEEIESIPGVDRTDVKGFPDQRLLINIDSEELFGNGLQIPDVFNGIEGELATQPLGVQEVSNQNVQLELSTLASSEEIEDIFIGLNPEGDSIYLQDIATVELENETPEDIVTFEDTPALSFTIFPGPGENIPALGNRVDERMQTLATDLPEEFTLDLFYTQETIVTKVIGDLSLSFGLAVLSVIVVTLLGLNISSAAIVALAIPSSVLIGLIPLPFLSVDLNQISIIGLIIALGILVDDAIVVGDNIRNKYREGMNPVEGALEGSREVRVSIITSTLAIVFTFLPLVFISGGNGDFIRALPTVLISTIIASTIIALTFVPIFLTWRRKKQVRKKGKKRRGNSDGLVGKQFNSLADWYSHTVLRKVVKNPWKVSIAGLALTFSFYALIPFIPVEFFPSTDRDEVTIDVTLPAGTPIAETEQTLLSMRDFVVSQDEFVYESSVYAGGGLPPIFGDGLENPGETTGSILLRVDRESQSAEETIDRWTSPLQEEYPDAVVELSTIEAGPPVGAPIAITLQGPDIEELVSISNELQSEIGDLPESGTVRDDIGQLRPTIVYEPNRPALEENQLTLADISEQIGLRTEGIPFMTFQTAEESVDLQLTLDRIEAGEELDLSQIEIPSQAQAEGPPEIVTLEELVDPVETEEIPQILREDGVRTVVVRVFPGEGDAAELEANIEEITDRVSSEISEDYTVSLGGETEARSDFIIELAILFIFVVFLIYILFAIQFYSLTIPFLILITVHIAASGAIVGLFITQTGLGFTALMGIVSLAGIVVRNSVVLLEFIKQRRKDGYELEDAVIEAGRVRLRPILLTALTAIAALIPVAFSGDVLFVPLAISIIAGLMFSAVLTVILVPSIYMAFAKKAQ
ncbi:efflux RND transporter permease subunit [Paenalkalicoccus suaedae]|uniref:Efflux RND transporter permease subunit n=1 Tax=Paenalkalicoccus suaedae TaxID=2592382 RepID=A0A859FAV5_9BACI|nr:efflux RND transporter permease subunit [Paenalkalicoccus suaedae]QKS70117.1 efflux RND transporter permease subunit [Paenalkalicoccus suaedae]